MLRSLRCALLCASLTLSSTLALAQAYNDTLAFLPNGNFISPLSVSTSSASVALPLGNSILIQNAGATAAFVKLTTGAGTATTTNTYVPAGGSIVLRVGIYTYLNAVTATSTTTLNITGGTGL